LLFFQVLRNLVAVVEHIAGWKGNQVEPVSIVCHCSMLR